MIVLGGVCALLALCALGWLFSYLSWRLADINRNEWRALSLNQLANSQRRADELRELARDLGAGREGLDPTDYTRQCACGERNKVRGEGECAICCAYRDRDRQQRLLMDIARAPNPDVRVQPAQPWPPQTATPRPGGLCRGAG